MSTPRYWLKQGRDTHVLIVDEEGTKVFQDTYFLVIEEDGAKVIRDLRYVLKEWLENCERVDFEGPFAFVVDKARNEITIPLSAVERIIVNLGVLVEWYMEHRVKVGLRRMIVEDLKEATDEA